jgi:hypothetical protein
VSVRGQIDGKQTFILIECKDSKRNVGIGAIDALDSKRHDVGADKTMIVSNSGFAEPALRKAQRKEIMCVSALAAGNDIIRFELYREFRAKKLSVERYEWKIYGAALPQDLKLDELEYKGKRFTAWLRDRSIKLLRENEFAKVIHHFIKFTHPVEFLRLGEPLLLRGIELHLQCRRFWVVQSIREDVSHGLYDHLKQVVLIPDKEVWSLQFDSRNWQEVVPDDGPETHEPAPGTVQLNMVLYNPIFWDGQGEAPALDDFIDKIETVVEPARSRASGTGSLR